MKHQWHNDENGGTATTVFCFTETELKSFTELIVRECVVMIKGYEFALGRKGELSKTMREYFGVE